MNNWSRTLGQTLGQIASALLLFMLSGCDVAVPGTDSGTSDRVIVMEWAGYELPEFREPFAASNPDTDIDYSFMEQDADAFSKLRSGFEVDLVHPCSNWWGMFVDAGLVQPIDTSRLENWDGILPQMAEMGVFDGEQYFVPWDWGYDSILVRTDLVDNVPTSWADLWNAEYAGHLALADVPESNRALASLVLGYDDPWKLTPEQNEAVKQELVELKENVLTYWVDPSSLAQQMASGDVWVAANVWPETYGALRDEGIPVEYIEPAEGRLGWVCGYGLSADAENVDAAYELMDALIAPQSMANLTNSQWYGGANADSFPMIDPEVTELLSLDRPEVLEQTVFYDPISDEERQEIVDTWEEVKASQ